MPTLIVPDIHERTDKLASIEVLMAKADRTVMLGDWFDAFGPRHPERMCAFILKHINDDGITFLWGNHDTHYAFSNTSYRCSGYDPSEQEIISVMLKVDTWSRFKIYAEVGPYLVSHAGFHPSTIEWANRDTEQEAIRVALDGGYDPIFGAGRARGGHQQIGGPTWMDWNEEFVHIPDRPQIVGHTYSPNVRFKGDEPRSWCVDCGLKKVAWVDGDVVTTEPL